MTSIQIVSDLHLEGRGYEANHIKPVAPYLALLGDIGCVVDAGYKSFLNRQLTQFRAVFHILGNHEPYGSNWDSTLTKFRRFEQENREKRKSESIGEYVLMFPGATGYDGRYGEYHIPNSNVTILGCTLFSAVPKHAMTAVSNGLNEFRCIDGWTVEEHCQMHQDDLEWLNDRVKSLSSGDADRKIVILTHHCPTEHPWAVDPLHVESDIKSGFQTDLSAEVCWQRPNVKLWAFGHTHFNCDFVDEETGKRVYSNQQGYWRELPDKFRRDHVLQLE